MDVAIKTEFPSSETILIVRLSPVDGNVAFVAIANTEILLSLFVIQRVDR